MNPAHLVPPAVHSTIVKSLTKLRPFPLNVNKKRKKVKLVMPDDVI